MKARGAEEEFFRRYSKETWISPALCKRQTIKGSRKM